MIGYPLSLPNAYASWENPAPPTLGTPNCDVWVTLVWVSRGRQEIAENFLPYILGYYGKYQNLGFWAIIEKSSQSDDLDWTSTGYTSVPLGQEFIGWIFLRPESDFKLLQQLDLAEADAVELGYRLRKSSWGQGYATEAAQALIDKSFNESNLNKIVAWALAENKASIRVMEKAGLKLQQEYVVTADMLTDTSLLENLLIQNLLNRQIVKYQIAKIHTLSH